MGEYGQCRDKAMWETPLPLQHTLRRMWKQKGERKEVGSSPFALVQHVE